MKLTEIINLIAETPGKNDKVDILVKYDSYNLRTILRHAYDIRYVYGVKKFPNVIAGEVDLEDKIEELEILLKSLHNRTVTGNAARDAIYNYTIFLNEESQTLVKNIILRDLRAGFSAGTINKAMPGLLSEEPPYMRCSLIKDSNFEKFPDEFYSQVKADGVYLNLSFDNGTVRAFTRNGTEFPAKFIEVYEYLSTIDGSGIICGELTVYKNRVLLDRKTGNGIIGSLLKGGVPEEDEELRFEAWDLIPITVKKKSSYNAPYKQRLQNLWDLIRESNSMKVIETKIVKSWEEAMEHYNACRHLGLEGTVIKNPEAIWKDGTSKDQIKMKAEVEIDLKIVGLNPGKGKNESTFGSIQMESECGKVEANVSGMSDELREQIFLNFESEYKGKIATVRSNQLIQSKNSDIVRLFLPRLIEVRYDKSEADDYDRIVSIFESSL